MWARGGADWSPSGMATAMCPNEKHDELFSSCSLPRSSPLHGNSSQREWKNSSWKNVGCHLPEGKCSGHRVSRYLLFYNHTLQSQWRSVVFCLTSSCFALFLGVLLEPVLNPPNSKPTVGLSASIGLANKRSALGSFLHFETRGEAALYLGSQSWEVET